MTSEYDWGRRDKFTLGEGAYHTAIVNCLRLCEMKGAPKSQCPPFFLRSIPHSLVTGNGSRQKILHRSPKGLSSEGFNGGVCET